MKAAGLWSEAVCFNRKEVVRGLLEDDLRSDTAGLTVVDVRVSGCEGGEGEKVEGVVLHLGAPYVPPRTFRWE